MATNDTDPQREQPFHDDPSRTEPGAPALDGSLDGPDASSGAASAASLLAGLAESSQPTPNVPETEGHVAAAYAAAPRRPPRPNDKTVENPAVFINATVPLPPPPSSGHQRLGPPASPVVSMKGDPTVLGGARLFEALQNQTDPGVRAKNQLRVYFAAIGGVVIAALIVITVLLIQRGPTTDARTSSSASPPTVASSAPPVVASAPVVVPSAAPVTAPSTNAGAPPAATVTTKPTSHGRPHATSPAPRPSGKFAEPDRHL